METALRAETKSPVVTILLSIITAAVLGSFTFLWGMNRDFGVMQERDRNRTESDKEFKTDLKEWKADVKEMKIDISEMKGKMITLQTTQEDMQRKANNNSTQNP